MQTAINYYHSNSIGYVGAMSMGQLFLPTFNQSPVATSAYEEASAQTKPAPILVRFESSTVPVWLRKAVRNVQEIVRLEDNWDTYGARPIEAEVAIAGLNLLLNVMVSDIPEPSIVPVPDGGIQFEWHQNGKHFEVEVLSSTEARFSFEDDENQQEIEDEGDLPSLEPRIRDLLQQVFHENRSTSCT